MHKTVLRQEEGSLSDGQLLDRYLQKRDDVAFAALVRRHGPMVWGVCQRIVGHAADADDAFQAAFLVLVRKAAAVKPREAVGNWLYGVACHTALKARTACIRVRAKEKQVTSMPEPANDPGEQREELHMLLDQELSALPHKYRLPVVLCELEGRTRKEVAAQLKIPEGTLSSRLATAHQMLARRLARHGLAVSGASLAALIAQNAASAYVPADVVAATLKTATLVAASQGAVTGVVSAKIAALTEGAIKAMFLSKLKTVAAVVLLLGAVAFGVGLYLAVGQPADHSGAAGALAERKEDLSKVERGRKDAEKPDDAPKKQSEENAAIEHLKKKGARFQRFEKILGEPVEPFWSVDLHATRVDDADLLHLKQIKDLKFLALGGNDLTDKGIRAVAELPQLTLLNLINLFEVTDLGLDKIADVGTLERLTLNGLNITDRGLKRFGRLHNLKHLDLRSLPITDEALKVLKTLKQLEELDLSKTKITDLGCAELVDLPALKLLNLEGAAVGNDGVKLLSGSKSLTSLNLSDTKIDDEGLRHISAFEKLDGLSLLRTRISDEGLKHLQASKLTNLWLAFLDNDKITDQGLRHLQDMKTLKQLMFQVSGTKATAEGLRRLEVSRPDLKINVGKK